MKNPIIVSTLVAATLAAGCASVQEAKVTDLGPVVILPPEFAAVVVFDCDQMKYVTFFDRQGKAEQQKIQSAAHLFDVQLRLALVPYENVQYVVNDRPCGFVVEEDAVQ